MPRRNAVRRAPNIRLKELRINAGLSPNDLAYRAGTTGNTIRLAEKGFTPGPRIQFAIAQVFEVRPLDIWPMEMQQQTPTRSLVGAR